MNREIKQLVKVQGDKHTHFFPAGLNILEKLWWRFLPGSVVRVKWPSGTIAVGYGDHRWYDVGATWVEIESADPNDFYRPWLEKYVGKQGIDWNWGFIGNDVAENCLTIKVRAAKSKYAIIMALHWAV